MIVKNYTGDKLNFGLAAQKARSDGLVVNVVFVGDDVSVEGNELVGRRGLAGVALVHKIAGAMASKGCDFCTFIRFQRLIAPICLGQLLKKLPKSHNLSQITWLLLA